jgi:hypothetical protein
MKKGMKIMYECEYGYYNDTKKDRKYFTDLYRQRGWSHISVTRTKTDTKGLKMYKITGIVYEN